MNKNLNNNYSYYLSKFKNNIFSNKKSSHPKALTPSHYQQKKIFLSKEKKYLPPKSQEFLNKKTLILDLDETLVHSSFEPFQKNDIVLNINFDGIFYKIYVLVRPGVDEFIKNISKYYELVIFTASLSNYASPLLDILDKEKKIQYRLYRDKCTFLNGVYIKPLKKIGRNLKDVVIVDNSPLAYAFDNDNGMPITSWFDDKNDKELYSITFLLEFLSKTNDVRKYIRKFVHFDRIDYSKAYKIIDEEEIIENILEKSTTNIYENKKNIEIQIDDQNFNINNNLIDNIFNKNNISKKQKKDPIDKGNYPSIICNILPTKKDNNPILINKNINKFISLENNLPLYQDIHLNDLEMNIINKINREKTKNRSEKKLTTPLNQQKNVTSNNDDINNKNKKLSHEKYFNLTHRTLKDKLISKKDSFKNLNKKKLTLSKGLALGISNTCKNIFQKKKNYNNFFHNSNYNLYNNKSNLNIFSYNKDKLLSTNNNINNINTINQYTCNFDSKHKDLLQQYNNNNLLNQEIKHKYMSFRNKAIIFASSQPKIKRRIHSYLNNKDFVEAKNKVNKEIHNNKNIKSKSSQNIHKKNVNDKINTDIRN